MRKWKTSKLSDIDMVYFEWHKNILKRWYPSSDFSVGRRLIYFFAHELQQARGC